MKLAELRETLSNEYISGQFFLDGDKVSWIYSTEGVDSAEKAEDRWLSFLGAKLTAQQLIEGTDLEIVQKFECSHKIGFSIMEKKSVEEKRRISTFFR
jgi:hypothetical protein